MMVTKLSPRLTRRFVVWGYAGIALATWYSVAVIATDRGVPLSLIWGGLTVSVLLNFLAAYLFCLNVRNGEFHGYFAFLNSPFGMMHADGHAKELTWAGHVLHCANVSGMMMTLWILAALIVRGIQSWLITRNSLVKSPMWDAVADQPVMVDGPI